jgi:hypothetical protein
MGPPCLVIDHDGQAVMLGFGPQTDRRGQGAGYVRGVLTIR